MISEGGGPVPELGGPGDAITASHHSQAPACGLISASLWLGPAFLGQPRQLDRDGDLLPAKASATASPSPSLSAAHPLRAGRVENRLSMCGFRETPAFPSFILGR